MSLFHYTCSKSHDSYIVTIDCLLATRSRIVGKACVLLTRGAVQQISTKKRVIIVAGDAIAKAIRDCIARASCSED